MELRDKGDTKPAGLSKGRLEPGDGDVGKPKLGGRVRVLEPGRDTS